MSFDQVATKHQTASAGPIQCHTVHSSSTHVLPGSPSQQYTYAGSLTGRSLDLALSQHMQHNTPAAIPAPLFTLAHHATS